MENEAYRTYQEYQAVADFFNKMHFSKGDKTARNYRETAKKWEVRAAKAFRIYLGFWMY